MMAEEICKEVEVDKNQMSPSAKRRNKKRLRQQRWNRIAPENTTNDAERATNLAEGTGNGVIDLSSSVGHNAIHPCVKCNKPNGRFRRLVSEQGDFLCDSCYKESFPATAMCETPARHSNPLHFITHKRRDNKSKDQWSEEEECRLCLNHGKFHRCCEKYYCDKCFFQAKKCPGCGIVVHRTGVLANQDGIKPGRVAVAASWGISLAVVLLFIVVVGSTIVNYYTAPITVWGHTCQGWFPKCNVELCVDMMNTPGFEIPIHYKYCNVTTTVNKIIGNTCAIDKQLYPWSDHSMGFDFCSTALKIGMHEISQRSMFNNGALVFEDDFNLWRSSTDYSEDGMQMASARWAKMKNAITSDICGVNKIDRKYDDGWRGGPVKESALVFTGVSFRYAQTVDLDLRFGGNVEFYLKLAPINLDESDGICKTAYGGDVALSYSTNEGVSWHVMAQYPVWKYQKEHFSLVGEIIPSAAWSVRTRFQWDQPIFDSRRDYWAIDDVRIFHNFDPEWRERREFDRSKKRRESAVQQVQCCLNTDHCKQFFNHTHMPDDQECGAMSGFLPAHRQFRLKPFEVFIAVSAILVFVKASYCYVSKSFFIVEHDQETLDEQDGVEQPLQFPAKKFSTSLQSSWQICAVLMLSAPAILIVFCVIYNVRSAILGRSEMQLDWFGLLLCIAAITLDVLTLLSLAKDVFHLWPFHPLRHIEVNTSPERNCLSIGKQNISRMDICKIEIYSRWFYLRLYICVLLSGYPFTSTCIFLQMLGLHHAESTTVILGLGCFAILRSLFGPKWFVKVYLCISWLASTSNDARDEMGRSLIEQTFPFMMANCTVAFFILALGGLCMSENINSRGVVVAVLVMSFLVGTLVGAIFGMMQGLPVVPDIHLTSWPKMGCYICYQHNETCSCLYSFSCCNGKHIHVRLLVVSLDDYTMFQRLINGSDDIKKIAEEK